MEADLLKAKLGPARLSHPVEWDDILDQLTIAGVEIEFRVGSLAYSPDAGGPGRMMIDPEASLGAIRHEFRHFLDMRDAGYPGLARYMENQAEFAKMEVRAYLEEVKLARELKHDDIIPGILRQMKNRVREIYGESPL